MVERARPRSKNRSDPARRRADERSPSAVRHGIDSLSVTPLVSRDRDATDTSTVTPLASPTGRTTVSRAARVREHLREERGDCLSTVDRCADAVAAGWDGPATTDREAVVPPMTAALRRTGVHDEFPAVLADAVAAAGETLRARPVAAPPYVVVTSVGPVLRATLDDARLVVTLAAFGVDRGEGPPRYSRLTDPVSRTLTVELR
jgi:hypothetical protein